MTFPSWGHSHSSRSGSLSLTLEETWAKAGRAGPDWSSVYLWGSLILGTESSFKNRGAECWASLPPSQHSPGAQMRAADSSPPGDTEEGDWVRYWGLCPQQCWHRRSRPELCPGTKLDPGFGSYPNSASVWILKLRFLERGPQHL